MPPRTRRSAAAAAAAAIALVSPSPSPPPPSRSRTSTRRRNAPPDMEIDSDVDMQDKDVDVDVDVEEGDEIEEEDGEGEVEGDDSGLDDDDDDDVGPPSSATTRTPSKPRLKITLKLPTNGGNRSNSASATPDELDFASYKRTPRRRAKTKVIQDVDVESEDPATSDSEDESGTPAASGSARAPGTTPSGRPMTTRQAVLASVVDPTHVSLNEGSRSKKQPLTEMELALRREETARKRKNLSEKKLEDEKAETINRLLKKQSRPRTKRNNANDSGAKAKAAITKPANQEGDEEDAEEEEEDTPESVAPVEEVKPTMYRWVSTIRKAEVLDNGMEVDTEEPTQDKGKQKQDDSPPTMRILWAVPEAALPQPPLGPTTVKTAADEETTSEAEALFKKQQEEAQRKAKAEAEAWAEEEKIRKARMPGTCAVDGCGLPRKYRAPKDWTVGACGMPHLKLVSAGL